MPSAPTRARYARFDWFEYEGNDPVYATAPEPDQYFNPILAGFYPDPAMTQVGDDYYLVSSTFSYFPGIPVFHSQDLVNWTQIGNAIDRPGMLDFGRLGISRGVFAPTIEHHDGVFFIANTCVDCGGNFIITATDPAGPWSDPIWLPHVGGIDPCLFFDDDGVIYILNNDAPPEPARYDGHRAIWIRAVDRTTFQPTSVPVVLIDGGVRPEERPIWIEGPHIYKVNGDYYLSAAEGGTAEGHSQVILRSGNVTGPYTPFEGNPILTQRHLDPHRPDPITSVGHASYSQTPDGRWWATFLGVRPYEGDFYNTGRETFLLPVRWHDGWPVITGDQERVPYVAERPALASQPRPRIPMNGNFTLRDEFSNPVLDHYWQLIRIPTERWYDLASTPGTLTLRARSIELGAFAQPSFVGRRQQHIYATASTSLQFDPQHPADEAGLVAFQNDEFYYFMGVGLDQGERVVRLKRRAGAGDPAAGVLLKSAPIVGNPDATVYLRIRSRGPEYDFDYATRRGDWVPLLEGADGRILSTRTAGGFVGVMLGMFAYATSDLADTHVAATTSLPIE